MKRFISVIAVFLMLFNFGFISFAEDLSVSAKGCVVMCADSRDVLFSKNSNDRLPMASTTKIMTAIIAIEYGVNDDLITLTDQMVNVEGSSIGLKAGDKISTLTLLKGLLLKSGNDAANSLAYIIGGSISEFVKLMNNKASALGLKNTSFATPSGLDSDKHYTTAYDLAVLTDYALKLPLFREICSSKSLTVKYGNPPYKRTLHNTNKLLKMCDYVVGVKTGFTKKSGRCLVSAGIKDNKTLIIVTLNASDDWNDHIKLYNKYFKLAKSMVVDADVSRCWLNIVGSMIKQVPVMACANKYYTYYDSYPRFKYEYNIKNFEYAPIVKGEVVGELLIQNEAGLLVYKVPLTAGGSAEFNYQIQKKSMLSRVKEFILNIIR